MQFQVPQFIEVEDKIFGPLTLKQFLYVAGGAGACLILFRFAPKIVAFPLMIPVIGFSATVAFYKLNGKPFISIVEAWFLYISSSKLYVWQKREHPVETTNIAPVEKAEGQTGVIALPKLNQSKLKELTWSLNIHETIATDSNTSAARLNLKE
ncbi:MAG: PrgI family protein [Candidatus Paceibacterota bacterium]